MRRALHLSTAALIAATSLFSVAAGDGDCHLARGAETADTADDLTVCREDVWFHEGDSKAGNLADTDYGSLPTFDTNAPEDSVAAGAGGGYAGSSLYQLTEEEPRAYTPTFVGEFTGDLDTLLIDMYLFAPASTLGQYMNEDPTGTLGTENFPWSVDLNLIVDGEPLISIGGQQLELEDGGNAVKRTRIAIVDILDAFEEAGLVGKSDAHSIQLEITGTGLASNAAIWVYDTTEAPSGMVFNIAPEDIPEGVFVHDMTPEWDF